MKRLDLHSSRDRNSGSDNSSAFIELNQRILHQPFKPFQTLVVLWLGARGYWQLRSLRRVHRRGRRRIGGADFVVSFPRSDLRTAVQIRHWKTPIQRRVIDELWGFMLRNGIPCGLIVTNSSFSKRAQQAIESYPGRPIQLVSREDLVTSMLALQLGVKFLGGRTVVDGAFFRTLNDLRLGPELDLLPKVKATGSTRIGLNETTSDSREKAIADAESKIRAGFFALVVIVLTLILSLLFGGRP